MSKALSFGPTPTMSSRSSGAVFAATPATGAAAENPSADLVSSTPSGSSSYSPSLVAEASAFAEFPSEYSRSAECSHAESPAA